LLYSFLKNVVVLCIVNICLVFWNYKWSVFCACSILFLAFDKHYQIYLTLSFKSVHFSHRKVFSLITENILNIAFNWLLKKQNNRCVLKKIKLFYQNYKFILMYIFRIFIYIYYFINIILLNIIELYYQYQ